jgi:hypothetical protein
MAGETRNLVFSEGTSVSAPAQVNLVATSIPTFASDAAFESNKGSSGTAGDIYQNTTDGLIHHHDGTSWKSVDNVLNNLSATTNPAIGNDDTEGYSVGSKWINTTSNTVFFALDVTTGAAVWRSMVDVESSQTLSGAKTFSSPVTVSDATNSTNKDTGSIVTEGGLGVEQDVNIGGSLTVGGDLTINGTTTTVNTSVLDVEDANITLNNGGNQASADGISGITVEMSDATDAAIVYDSTLASKWKLGDSSLKEVVDVSSVQNLTNKNLYDISTIFVSSGDTTKQLKIDLSGNGTGDKVTFIFNASTTLDKFNFPDTVGTTVNVTTDNLQATLTNKDIDGGTASDNSRITLSKNTRANLDGLTRKEGTIFYDTTNSTIVYDNGTVITEITGSSAFASGITTDTIGEFTGNAGVTIDSTLVKDGLVNAGASGSATTPAYSFVGDENTGMYRVGADQLGFATNGTQILSINSSGLVTIGETSGTQIHKINGGLQLDNGGSSLDHYEEGTFSAVLKEGANTLTTLTAYYTRTGDICHVAINFENITPAAATGALTITGLPFTSAASTVHQLGLKHELVNTGSGYLPNTRINPSQTTVVLLAYSETGGANITINANMLTVNTSDIGVSGTYKVA